MWTTVRAALYVLGSRLRHPRIIKSVQIDATVFATTIVVLLASFVAVTMGRL